MGISDNLGNKAKATKTKTNQPQSIEGNELALALQSTALQQAESMANLIHAYDAGMDESAEVVASAIASRVDGSYFYGRVLEKVAERHTPIESTQTFEAPVLDISANPFSEVREGFMALFGSTQKKTLSFADLGGASDE